VNYAPWGRYFVKTIRHKNRKRVKLASKEQHQELEHHCRDHYKSLVIYASRYNLTKPLSTTEKKKRPPLIAAKQQQHLPPPPPRQLKQPQWSGLAMPVTAHYIAPRAPIALCHGLYGFDKRGPESIPFLQVHYWGGIEEALAKLGAKVIVTRVPRTGSIWERAQVLHTFLNSVLQGEQVNLIAHSMVRKDSVL
jgi:hypothetical protein